MPDYVKGIINLRDKAIPIVDVRKRFKFEERAYDDRTCIEVVNINDTSLGLVVDTVKEVSDIPEKTYSRRLKSQKETVSFLSGERVRLKKR